MKSEPSCFSIDDLKKAKIAPWDGVRNYQARNYMRDDMRTGDIVLFYHSNCAEPGVVGVASVAGEAYPDHTAWDPHSEHPDPRSTPERPLWYMVDVAYVDTFAKPVTLRILKADPFFANMLVVQRGQRLSIQPVEKRHAKRIISLGMRK